MSGKCRFLRTFFDKKDFHRRQNSFSLCVCWLKRCLSLSQRQGFSALVPVVSQMFAVVLLSGCGNRAPPIRLTYECFQINFHWKNLLK